MVRWGRSAVIEHDITWCCAGQVRPNFIGQMLAHCVAERNPSFPVADFKSSIDFLFPSGDYILSEHRLEELDVRSVIQRNFINIL